MRLAALLFLLALPAYAADPPPAFVMVPMAEAIRVQQVIDAMDKAIDELREENAKLRQRKDCA